MGQRGESRTGESTGPGKTNSVNHLLIAFSSLKVMNIKEKINHCYHMALIQQPSVCREGERGERENGGIFNLVSYRGLIYFSITLSTFFLFIPFLPVISPTFLLPSFKYLRFITLQPAFLWKGTVCTLKHMLIVNTHSIGCFGSFWDFHLKQPMRALYSAS